MVKFPFGVAVGVVQHHGVGVRSCGGDGDDDHLLDGGVDHAAVEHEVVAVVDGDAHIAETFVEVDINGIICHFRFDGIRINASHQITM